MKLALFRISLLNIFLTLIAVGVGALPTPAVGAHALDAVLGLGLGGVGVAGGDVAGAAGLDSVGNVDAGCGHEGVHQLEHGGALAGAQVVDAHAGLLDGLEGRDVAAGQVDDVDVVADAGAVGGVVVVVEDAQLLKLADGDLGDVGHQVVGDAGGVLAHGAALVGADGVEVAQQHDAHVGVGPLHVGQDVLDLALGAAVGVGGLVLGLGLGDGARVGGAVHRGGAGEDDVLAVSGAHGAQQGESAVHVVVVVLEGLNHGLADGLEAGEVDDAVDRRRGEHGVHGGLVADVALDERGAGTRDGLDAVENHRVGVAQVVVDDDLVARLLQLNDGVAANEAGATGNKNPHKLPI